MARPRKVDTGDAPKKYAHQDWFRIGNVSCAIFGFHKKSGDGIRDTYTITHTYTDSDGNRQRTDFFPEGEGLTIKAAVDEAERRIARNKELHKISAEVHAEVIGTQPQAAVEPAPAKSEDAPVE